MQNTSKCRAVVKIYFQECHFKLLIYAVKSITGISTFFNKISIIYHLLFVHHSIQLYIFCIIYFCLIKKVIVFMSADLSVNRHYGITLWRMRPHLRKQLLFQNYKEQRHAVFLEDTLSIEDEKVFKACRSVHSSVPQSHYK